MGANLLEAAATGNLRVTLSSAPTAKGLLLAQSEFEVAGEVPPSAKARLAAR
jgi:hypothetical protein